MSDTRPTLADRYCAALDAAHAACRARDVLRRDLDARNAGDVTPGDLDALRAAEDAACVAHLRARVWGALVALKNRGAAL